MNRFNLIALSFAVIQLAGCGGGTPSAQNPGNGAQLPKSLWATAKIEGAKEILAVKADAKEGDLVTLRGVIGGAEKPFVDGRAVAMLVDMSVPTCADNGESCPTPWDYCCVPKDEKAKAMATIQVVDDAGNPLKVSLASGNQLKPHAVVTVQGKVGPRPDANVLVINVTSIHVDAQKK